MAFTFIDNNATIDRAARRRIRSHVATGKNVGKTLIRPSRIKKAPEFYDISKNVEPLHDVKNSKNVAQEVERQLGNGLSVLSFPYQVNPRSASLVQKVLSFINVPRANPGVSNALDTTGSHTSMWVQYMFMDDAYFHCVMAMSVFVLNNILISPEDPKEAIRHLLQTFHLVNQRISENQPISDTTLAVVVVMAQYARLQGQYRQGRIHLKGLRQMIKSRGGLTSVEPGLTQMIFKTDLEYALYEGTSTNFTVEDIVASNTNMYVVSNYTASKDIARDISIPFFRLHEQSSADLQDILTDMKGLAQQVNDFNTAHQPALDGSCFHDRLILFGYRLININPLCGPRPISQLENLAHQGLISFMIPFLRGFDRKLPNMPLLYDLICSAVQGDPGGEQETLEVLLWTMFVSVASMFKEPDDKWLVPRVAWTMRALDLSSWDDVVRILKQFPWINAVHSEAGQALWHRAKGRNLSLVEDITK